jgi:gliding motility-associated-like protein
MIKKIFFLAGIFITLSTQLTHSQIDVAGGESCDEVQPFCSDNTGQFVFRNVTNVNGDGSVGCLNSADQPAWFFIRVEQTGRLEFLIEQNQSQDFNGAGIDVDFIAWGPFGGSNDNCDNLDPTCAGGGGCPNNTDNPNFYLNNLDNSNIVDCSWSALAVESFTIPDAVAGEFYILLISNFDNVPGFIRLTQTNFGNGDAGSTDCSIISGDLGPDQDVCEGEIVTLDGTPTSGTAVSFDWFFDDGSGFAPITGQNNATLQIGGAGGIPEMSGTYRVIVTDIEGNDASDDVVITFFPQPTIGNLGFTTFEQCDTDGNEDGFFTFDLLALFANDLLDGQDPTVFDVVFYQTQTDADNNTNPIANPTTYTNQVAFAADEIFARIINRDAPDACSPATTSFELLVQPNPTINVTTDYELCDDNVDGDDTNGIVQSFVLSTKDADILGGQNPADFTVSYYLNPTDAENGTNALDKINPIANTSSPQPIFVRVQNNTTGCFTFTETDPLFNLIVNSLPVVTNPVLLEACDDDQNGQFNFNLTAANSLISANAANETFRYYPTEADAENDTNVILDPTSYENVDITNDAAWARTINTNGCFRISRIDLEVTSTIIPNSFQQTFEECDDFLDAQGNDTANNDDTDGITNFDFGADITTDILALFPTNQQSNITVTYYENQTDANNATNAIPDIRNYRNSNSPNSQQIYIRVENSANNTCLYVGTHITLIVNPTPQAFPVPDLDICDDDTDGDDTNGFVQNINLESQTLGVLGSQNPADFTVTYHETASDATAGSNPLTSPYTNTVQNGQTIYVRVTDNVTGCYTDRSSFDVNIRPLPIITNSVLLRQCDDDTDGRAPFNLNEANTLISGNASNENFVFFESLADAQTGFNAIPNPTNYINNVPTNDVVWARAISSFGCFRIAEVNLVVATNSAVVQNYPPETYHVCDDFLDAQGNDTANNNDTDGITTFDFSGFSMPLIQEFPPNEQPNLIVSYYRNLADALAELNAIDDPSNYRNIGSPNTQQIYVRVDNTTNNECVGVVPLITLIVDPVPVSNPVQDLELCDNADDGDFSNGFVQTFNLESQTPTILGTQDPATYTVTYHTSPNDASTGANPITNTTSYTNATANRETIYIRVEHNTQGCYVDRGRFDLVVNPLPIANFVPDLEVCDTGAPGTATDGVVSGIDLEVQTAGILGDQNPNQFTVTYHRLFTDARDNIDPIVGLYTNETAFTQTIHVRIVNNVTGCVNSISNFNLIVHPEPTVVDIVELPYCDDDLDGNDTNGFVQNIDLDSQIPHILGSGQDEDDFTVTFHEDPNDAISGANPLSSPYANTTANSQAIYVRVVNDDTGCVNSSYSFNVVINPLPDFQVTSPQTICVNDPDLTLAVENPAGIYDYVWTDPEGNETIGSQISATVGGIYSVTGTATDGTGCQRVREVEVIESIIATITDQNIEIVDDSENNSITIDPTNLGIGDYEYALADENGIVIVSYQDTPVFDNLEGGFYTVLVRDKNGCGVARLDVPVVEFPKFFTPNNDGINDTWAIKGANSTFFPNSEVNIFNRFGKVVAQIDIDNPGWDGTFNGKTLPSDDYWYSIKLTDRNGVVRERQGNLSLLRR